MNIKLSNLPLVIYSCFVLHNFSEMEKDPINESKFNKVVNYDKLAQPSTKVNRENHNHGAKLIRKIYTNFFEYC